MHLKLLIVDTDATQLLLIVFKKLAKINYPGWKKIVLFNRKKIFSVSLTLAWLKGSRKKGSSEINLSFSC